MHLSLPGDVAVSDELEELVEFPLFVVEAPVDPGFGYAQSSEGLLCLGSWLIELYPEG